MNKASATTTADTAGQGGGAGSIPRSTGRGRPIRRCDFCRFTGVLSRHRSFRRARRRWPAAPRGSPPSPAPRQNLLTVTRVVHSYALGEMLGIPGCRGIVDRGLTALWDEHRDPVAGGYVEAVGLDGSGDTTKAAYGHAHVLLAAASALAAGHAGAGAIFDDALAVIDERFWSDRTAPPRPRPTTASGGRSRHTAARTATCTCARACSPPPRSASAPTSPSARPGSRGGSSTSRLALTAGCSRALRPVVATDARVQPRAARRPVPTLRSDHRALARVVAARGVRRLATGRLEDWFVDASESMFGRGVNVGWDRDHGGLVYTVDWNGAPANPDHYWWPVAEGIATSSYLLRVTGRRAYEGWYRTFWDYAATHLVDHERGGWYPELDPTQPSEGPSLVRQARHLPLAPGVPAADPPGRLERGRSRFGRRTAAGA